MSFFVLLSSARDHIVHIHLPVSPPNKAHTYCIQWNWFDISNIPSIVLLPSPPPMFSSVQFLSSSIVDTVTLPLSPPLSSTYCCLLSATSRHIVCRSHAHNVGRPFILLTLSTDDDDDDETKAALNILLCRRTTTTTTTGSDMEWREEGREKETKFKLESSSVQFNSGQNRSSNHHHHHHHQRPGLVIPGGSWSAETRILGSCCCCCGGGEFLCNSILWSQWQCGFISSFGTVPLEGCSRRQQ